MEDLAKNNRSFLTATLTMIGFGAAIVIVGMILFPLSLYTNPNAGPIPNLVNTPQGNLLVISLFGLLAADIGVFLNRVIRLERERTAILERGANRESDTPLPPPSQGAIKSGQK
jgi:hypothetical protein